jgi:hypothetical protein
MATPRSTATRHSLAVRQESLAMNWLPATMLSGRLADYDAFLD